jgi:hypothetical protein
MEIELNSSDLSQGLFLSQGLRINPPLNDRAPKQSSKQSFFSKDGYGGRASMDGSKENGLNMY